MPQFPDACLSSQMCSRHNVAWHFQHYAKQIGMLTNDGLAAQAAGSK